MAEEKPAAHRCGGCAAPLPGAALGRGTLMFETAETRGLCARCTLEYYRRTGGLGAGGRSTGTCGVDTGGMTRAPSSWSPAGGASGTPEGRGPMGNTETSWSDCRKSSSLVG